MKSNSSSLSSFRTHGCRIHVAGSHGYVRVQEHPFSIPVNLHVVMDSCDVSAVVMQRTAATYQFLNLHIIEIIVIQMSHKQNMGTLEGKDAATSHSVHVTLVDTEFHEINFQTPSFSVVSVTTYVEQQYEEDSNLTVSVNISNCVFRDIVFQQGGGILSVDPGGGFKNPGLDPTKPFYKNYKSQTLNVFIDGVRIWNIHRYNTGITLQIVGLIAIVGEGDTAEESSFRNIYGNFTNIHYSNSSGRVVVINGGISRPIRNNERQEYFFDAIEASNITSLHQSGGVIRLTPEANVFVTIGTIMATNITVPNRGNGVLRLGGYVTIVKFDLLIARDTVTFEGGSVIGASGNAKAFIQKIVSYNGNCFDRGGVGSFGGDSTITIENLTVVNSRASLVGGVLHVFDRARVALHHVTTRNTSALLDGGFATAAGKSQLVITNASMYDSISFRSGGVLSVENDSQVVLGDVYVYNATAMVSGGTIKVKDNGSVLLQSTLHVVGSQSMQGNGGVVSVESEGTAMFVQTCNTTKSFVGLFYAQNVNAGGYGGTIAVEGTSSKIRMFDCFMTTIHIINSSSVSGGGMLYCGDGAECRFENVAMLVNTSYSSKGAGGFVYSKSANVNITCTKIGNSFISSSIGTAGGGACAFANHTYGEKFTASLSMSHCIFSRCVSCDSNTMPPRYLLRDDEIGNVVTTLTPSNINNESTSVSLENISFPNPTSITKGVTSVTTSSTRSCSIALRTQPPWWWWQWGCRTAAVADGARYVVHEILPISIPQRKEC
eukprot:PhF_6_TR12643/c0_g2_i1/m.20044